MRTTAQECRVRGGEYVLEDRASLASALRVWLPAAEAGDPEAQTTLGEMFEQGLGVKPDYQVARTWYEKAAAKEFPRALTNLGNLYERGLGVARNPAKGLFYYRRAVGLPPDSPAMSIDDVSDVAPVEVLVRQQTSDLEAKLASIKAQNKELKLALAEADDEALQFRDLKENLTARDRQIEQLSQMVEGLRAQSIDAGQLRTQLTDLRMLIADQEEQQQERTTEFQQLVTQKDKLAEIVARQDRQLEAKDKAAQTLLTELNMLVAEITNLKTQVNKPEAPVSPDVTVAGPAISIIDPILPATRGLVKVKVPLNSTVANSGVSVIGRVTAPAGLMRLTVNRAAVTPNEAGVFNYDLELESGGEVVVTAIDRRGQRTDLTFELADETSVSSNQTLTDIELGRYKALLIGNSNYRYLPQLKTPTRDIHALQEVLSDQYGFEVQMLLDASRYEILSALNNLRANLTSDDNLLIFYAGHGELDRTNMRGHWLPVDAELASTANWLSNVTITDMLNVIQARQIMLVVDSCYSGTLTRSSLTRIDAAKTQAERETWLRLMVEKKSRVVMTSGGLAPVLDGGGGQHSVFARAFLQALTTNGELLTGRALYESVAARVAHAAQAFEFEQIPAYAPIARSGHEAGDFVLLPVPR